MNRKIINGLIVVCVTLCCPCTVISSIAGGAVVTETLATPEDVNIQVTGPTTVAKGETFAIEVQVENLAKYPQSLDSIDVALEYLAGIDIQKTEPPFTESSGNPDTYQYQSYYFEQSIPPGDTLTVQLFSVGRKAGDFSGEIAICINSPSRCSNFPVHTLVEE